MRPIKIVTKKSLRFAFISLINEPDGEGAAPTATVTGEAIKPKRRRGRRGGRGRHKPATPAA